MSQIALSIEQMKHLEELGLDTSDASMVWKKDGNGFLLRAYILTIKPELAKISKICYAYTLQDIISKLPGWIREYQLNIKKNAFEYYNEDADETKDAPGWWLHMEADDDILLCGYRMLVWCIENGYVETNKEL